MKYDTMLHIGRCLSDQQVVYIAGNISTYLKFIDVDFENETDDPCSLKLCFGIIYCTQYTEHASLKD